MTHTNSCHQTPISRNTSHLRATAVLTTLVLLAGMAWAQTASTGAISGTITDPSGALLAGASVKVSNETTGESRTVVSGRDGSFLAPLLLPGKYRVEVSTTGFKTLVRI